MLYKALYCLLPLISCSNSVLSNAEAVNSTNIDIQDSVRCTIECLAGDTIKYEYNIMSSEVTPDSIDGKIRVILRPFPAYYGFTKIYKSNDGDWLDVFIFSENPLERGSNHHFTPQYLVYLLDQGVEDCKLVCSNNEITDMNIIEIITFMQNYSTDKIEIKKIQKIESIKQFIDIIINLNLIYQ